MYIAYYVFGVGHTERHYLKNPAGKKYEIAVTQDPAAAKSYSTHDAAERAIRAFLKNDPHMIPLIEPV
jgi:hypothetical protein